jgi:hypothetical protein
MHVARVLVFSGWLSAAVVLVHAVACSNSVEKGPEADAGGPFDGHTADISSEMTPDTWTADSGPDSPAGDSMPGDSTVADSVPPADAHEGGEGDSPEESDSAPCVAPAIGGTECVLQARSANCLTCADPSGCIDPLSQNLSCDQFVDGGQSDCLATLACALEAGCGVTSDNPSCLCGSEDASACEGDAEAPAGPCADTYFAGFGTHNVTDILASFEDPSNPSGNANGLVQCLQMTSCTACF